MGAGLVVKSSAPNAAHGDQATIERTAIILATRRSGHTLAVDIDDGKLLGCIGLKTITNPQGHLGLETGGSGVHRLGEIKAEVIAGLGTAAI